MTGSLKEAGLQESVRTNRNCIRGTVTRVSNHIFAKPKTNIHYRVDAAGIDFKDKCLTRGDLGDVCREVSRGHSTVIVCLLREGLKVNRSKLSWDEFGMYGSNPIPVQAHHEEEQGRNFADG